MTRLPVLLACLLTLGAMSAQTASAQSFMDQIRRAAERTVEREVGRLTDQAITGAIECVVGDRACEATAKQENREIRYVSPPSGGTATGATAAPASASAPAADRPLAATQAWANYDFVPGERVLFAEDFAADRVGNFPRRLGFISGTLELVELDGRRMLRATSDGRFQIVLPEALPERFTMEFDVHLPHSWHQVHVAFREPSGGFRSLRTAYRGIDGYKLGYVQLGTQGKSGIRSGGTGGEALADYPPLAQGIVPVRIMADGDYAKVFLNERRVANVPNADLQRGGTIGVYLSGEVAEARPILIGNFRIAAGGPSLYDALQANGRVSTQGILFDTGSDRIRPESTPTLKEIAAMLRQRPELRLRIEGHTDSVGDDAANRTLSAQRARAVVEHLVRQERIPEGQMESEGLGASRPAADNGTPEGRQTNRRVELVVLK